MKQSQLSILFPRQEEVTYREIPEETWHDLGLDILAEKVASQPQEVQLIRRVMMSLTADPRVAAFRSDVFEDIMRHPEIRERLMKLLDKVKMFYDYGVVNRHEGDETSIWDLMHRLEEYHDYILTVEAIRECLSDKDLVSEGLTALRDAAGNEFPVQHFEGKAYAFVKGMAPMTATPVPTEPLTSIITSCTRKGRKISAPKRLSLPLLVFRLTQAMIPPRTRAAAADSRNMEAVAVSP